MITAQNDAPAEKKQRERILAPVAYSEASMPSLRLARSSRRARRIAKVLVALLIIAFLIVAIAPWQQSVTGNGSVIAYDPLERQQLIESPIKGRIVLWGDGVVENAHVKKDDLIAEIQDIDYDYLRRLEDQLLASQRQVQAAADVLESNRRNLDAAKTIVEAHTSRLDAYKLVKQEVVASADAAIESAKNKIKAEQEQLAEYEAERTLAQADHDRQEQLYKERIAAQFKFQDALRKLRVSEAKVRKSNAYIASAKNELTSKQRDRDAKEKKADVDIEYAKAELRKSNANVAKAQSDIAKAQAELNKAEKAVLESETKVERQRSQKIVAPFDGYLTQIYPNQGSQILKEGDPICLIVPETSDRAVQIWLDGNDAPLVEPGRHVRLQFEGWPAMQFAGWPSVAVGTFGGEIVSVDAVDNGKGQFRVLILPDATDQQWPEDRFLRQGVRTNGWVLLNQVPLWYEIWRQMNGFPPVVSSGEPKESKTAKPKLPK